MCNHAYKPVGWLLNQQAFHCSKCNKVEWRNVPKSQ